MKNNEGQGIQGMDKLRTISTTAELESLCGRLSGEDFIAVDTEFVREKTFWPILSLIQLGTAETLALVDPLSTDLDLTPLWHLFGNATVLKVFHAAQQDLEIFTHMSPIPFRSLFDTQLAYLLLGQQNMVSYEVLVGDFLGIKLDKALQVSAWDHRPLSSAQLAYAADDVRYLAQIYPQISLQISNIDRKNWLDDEYFEITNPATYIVKPADAWRKVKGKDDSPPVLGRIAVLAAWRESMAQQHDKPRRHILSDEDLCVLARLPALDRVRLMKVCKVSCRSQDTEMLELQFSEATPINLPKKPAKIDMVALQRLKTLLLQKAEENKVGARLIATMDELRAFLAHPGEDYRFMQGWRHEIFGKHI